jgi:type VI secretion system ImpB/VipA family protein
MPLTPSRANNGRINLTYSNDKGEHVVEELPLRFFVLGDFTGRESDKPIAKRQEDISMLTFDNVMKRHDVGLALTDVPNVFAPPAAEGEAGPAAAPMALKFESIGDFHPDRVLDQLTTGDRPQNAALAQAVRLRAALVTLKGPMGTRAGFRKAIERIIADPAARQRIEKLLGVAQ